MKLVPDWLLSWSPDTARVVIREAHHPCCGSPLTAEHRPECDNAEHLVMIGGKPAVMTSVEKRAAGL